MRAWELSIKENKAINLTPNVKLWVNSQSGTIIDVPSDLHHTQMAHLYPQKFGLSGKLFNDHEYPINDEGRPELYDEHVAIKMYDAGWVRVNMGSRLQTAMVQSDDLKKCAGALRVLKQKYNEIDTAIIDIGTEITPSENYTLANDEHGKGQLRTFIRTGKIPDKVGQFREDEETLKLPSISVGDELKIGKFKNRKATVKGFKKDDNNHPIAKTTKGDVQLLKPRVTKLLPKDKS